MAEPSNLSIEVDIPAQLLVVRNAAGHTVFETQVATARKGAGELINSECTPRGHHLVRAKIGAGQPLNAVFISRRPTGEIYSPALRALHPARDWILTRILWLSGLEPGKNRLKDVDTMRRFIYIHGCPDEDPMGVPSSRGCIKMRNRDIVALFERIGPGTPVLIRA
jgi:lipoprotein-anchoring transpeptidase ErfK/SrfK